MIEYVVIRNQNREKIGIVDAFESIIWNVVYYGVGSFEIYAPYDDNNAELLQIGNYVTRHGRRDVGIIEDININNDSGGALMITATGRFAKSILDRRLIYSLNGNTITPVVFSGNVETAARALVNQSIINATDSARNISFIELGALTGLTAKLQDSRQTSYGGLLEITDELLQEFNYSSYMTLNESTLKLQYIICAGQDRTIGSENPLIFSQEYDTLLSTDYRKYDTNLKNVALIGGAGEGTDRKYILIDDERREGINRREIFVDGSSNSETYQNEETGETETYPTGEYLGMLTTNARQELLFYKSAEEINGEIDITTAGVELEKDYNVGDIVNIIDNVLNIAVKSRIMTVTEVQDGGGFSVSVSVENSDSNISYEALTAETSDVLTTESGDIIITRWI